MHPHRVVPPHGVPRNHSVHWPCCCAALSLISCIDSFGRSIAVQGPVIPMYPDFLETLLRIFWEGSGKLLGSFWEAEFSGLYRLDERYARERRRTSPTSYFPNIVLP